MYAEISSFTKIFHILPVIPVYLVISTVTISVTKYFMLNEKCSPFPKIIFGGIFYLFSIMVLVTHTLSMWTSPGYVEYGYKNKSNSNDPNVSQGHLFCKKCRNERPPRAHHCKSCKKCTLKMDHHCPWIANCVGFRNQKFFYQFLFYATFGDLLGFFLIISHLFNGLESNAIDSNKNQNKQFDSVWDIVWQMWTPIMIVISATVAMAMTLAIGLLFVIQTKMILYNQTTVETHIFSDYSLNPWYYEDKLHNFQIVMGNTFIEWFLPIFKANKFNNGYYFYTPKNVSFSDLSNKNNINYLQLGADLELQEGSQDVISSTMSIIHALIARDPDIVLCEHSEHSGNFLQISRVILQKAIKPESKQIITYDNHKFFYINENRLTYLCLAEGIKDNIAFAFLYDIRKKLLQNYDYNNLSEYNSFQLNEFTEILKQYMNYYNTNPNKTKTGEIIDELSAAKDIVTENVEKLLEREHKLNIIATKSENLGALSLNMKNISANVRKEEERKKMQMIVLIAAAVVLILLILYYMS